MISVRKNGKIKYLTKSCVRDRIGRNIVRLREARNISQTELVAKLNLLGCTADRFAISSIENIHSCDLNLPADTRKRLRRSACGAAFDYAIAVPAGQIGGRLDLSFSGVFQVTAYLFTNVLH